MEQIRTDEIRENVRDFYGQIAEGTRAGCGCESTGCCGGEGLVSAADISVAMGYSPADVTGVPAGANLGLGCGNPQAIAALQPGETVLDLGSGAGFDCFLAARAVGPAGRVIGVDMTPQMLSKARGNAATAGLENVEFRLGEIENLPVADDTVDVIISNCVINLSPQKGQVFAEAFRVLKPGGRLAISDTVTTATLPAEVQADLALHAACISGAATIAELEAILAQSGFTQIAIQPKEESRAIVRDWVPGARLDDYILSATIEAIKPG